MQISGEQIFRVRLSVCALRFDLSSVIGYDYVSTYRSHSMHIHFSEILFMLQYALLRYNVLSIF